MKNKNTTTTVSHSVLGEGAMIKGELHVAGDVRIDGNVIGSITCKSKVIVGAQAEIEGSIQCENLDVMGQIKGNVTVLELLTLSATSVLIGDAKVKTISIEPKAQFNGACEMITDSPVASAEKPIGKEKEASK